MRTLLYYSLLQIPGLAVLGLILATAVYYDWLSIAVAAALWTAWLIKDAIMYPFVKSAFEPARPGDSGPEGLVGSIGTTTRELTPAGFIRVRGELWQAECVAEPPDNAASSGRSAGSATPIEVNRRVKIVAARGMVLLVQPAPESEV